MDPRQVELIRAAMDAAMRQLEQEYITLMLRLGCKRITVYR